MRNRILDYVNGGQWVDCPSDAMVGEDADAKAESDQPLIERWIGAYPAIWLGTAVVAGIALGWWVKRK